MRRFSALYTHQKQKKVKAWQEGIIIYNNSQREITLFDVNNDRITSYRLRVKESIEIGNEYDVGKFLVTLEDETFNPDTSNIEEDRDDTSEAPQKQVHPTRTGLNPIKRPRKHTSLIKPIKLKGTDKPIASDQNETSKIQIASDSHDLTQPSTAIEYSILYTTQKIKKVKAWQEGTLRFDAESQRISLRDSDSNVVLNSHIPKSKVIEIGAEIDHGPYLIQIDGLKDETSTSTNKSNIHPTDTSLSVSERRRRAIGGLSMSGAMVGSRSLRRSGLKKTLSKSKDASSHEHISPVLSRASSGDDLAIRGVIESSSSLQSRVPRLLRKGSSSFGSSSEENNSLDLHTSTLRRSFVSPRSTKPEYLHFPRRSELLQHVGVSKGYNFGPMRELTAPLTYRDWHEYQEKFSALLKENMMAELSSIAIRYHFMAREKFENQEQYGKGPANETVGQKRRRLLSKAGKSRSGLEQMCKSVGVYYFEGCTLKQPFIDSEKFRAQSNGDSITFNKGDSVILELTRRESYAGFAKDDTWAVSIASDFPTDTTFLARSVFFGQSKNNTLELMLVGDHDAEAASRIFNSTVDVCNSLSRRRPIKAEVTVVALRCLDSASDWSMMDTIDTLDPDSLPILPHILNKEQGPALHKPQPESTMEDSDGVDMNEALVLIESIIREKQKEYNLNENQAEVLKQAVFSAVSLYIPIENVSPVTIIHGPFGTGKSFLSSIIVICLDEIRTELPEMFGWQETQTEEVRCTTNGDIDVNSRDTSKNSKPRLRVLLSSMTNFAVDNMLSALLKRSYDQFLRIGNLKRISKEILPYVCRASASATDAVKDLEDMLKNTIDEDERECIEITIQRVRKQKVQDALDNAFVVGTTCLSSTTSAMRNIEFPVVILDEACQIVEPMALIALASARCHRIILIGDPLQLPPTLTTRAVRPAEGKGLDRALFARLVGTGHLPLFLSMQYRCHPQIGSLCNQMFYSGRLQHGITCEDRRPLVDGLSSVMFLETNGQEKQQGKSQSFFNQGEVTAITQLVQQLLSNGLNPDDIGVIALYKTQADILKDRLAEIQIPGSRSNVQVSTVDAYQGSEREVIIISCVRTEKIGFISNPNRINVALSRARRHCLILGSKKLLASNNMWRQIIECCAADPQGVGIAQATINALRCRAADVGLEDAGRVSGPGPGCVQDGVEIEESENAQDQTEMLNQATRSGDVTSDDNVELEFNSTEFDEDSMVGATLSQWSLPDVDVDRVDGDSGEVDIFDCLDVDLDEM